MTVARRLAIVRPSVDAGVDALEHLRALVLAAVPELDELLAGARQNDELVDLLAMLPGARAGERRKAMRDCRQGKIRGAVKLARRWRAPRASVDDWLRSCGPRAVSAPAEQGDELEDMRRALARPARRAR